MNHHALEEKVEAVLEATFIRKGSEMKTSLVFASRINGNGSWRYVRNNGQKFGKEKTLNPMEMAKNMVKVGIKDGYQEYQVHYLWRPEKGQTKEGIVKYKK